jgi:ABC-type spermidine/putrescine transport system permease subunit II
MSFEAAQFLQQALANSLQTAFLTGLMAVIIATIIAALIPGGNVHDLIHAEPQAQSAREQEG